jgi:hypothetical protein
VESRANGLALPVSDRLGEVPPIPSGRDRYSVMDKDCVKLERLFQEVADLPEDELLTYVSRWGSHTKCFDKDE